mgnify:CR=1 FL=1
MKTREELVTEAIEKARKAQQEEKESRTIITEHENEVKTVTEFYRKGKAIWCKMTTGCITTNSRVYKVNTDKPYIRDMGAYWYLGEREKAIIAAM